MPKYSPKAGIPSKWAPNRKQMLQGFPSISLGEAQALGPRGHKTLKVLLGFLTGRFIDVYGEIQKECMGEIEKDSTINKNNVNTNINNEL